MKRISRILAVPMILILSVLLASCGVSANVTNPKEDPTVSVSSSLTPSKELTSQQSQELLISKDFLPIGTVVLLKNSTRKIMIIGVLQYKDKDKSKLYDYSAVLYPVGLLNPDQNYLFDKSQIQRIYYLGYWDSQENDLQQTIQDALAKQSTSDAPSSSSSSTSPTPSKELASQQSQELLVSKNFLPIGSIVVLKDSYQKEMIIGVLQYNGNDKSKLYDYSAVLYPAGLIDPDSNYLFDKSQIQRVYYLGYWNDEEDALQQTIKDTLAKQGISN